MKETDMETVYLSLGSNEGDCRGHLLAAIAALREIEGAEVTAVSSFYICEPIGMAPGAPDFFNCAVELRTALDPLALLDKLEAIESAFGRGSKRLNANRTIDIDILLYGSQIVALPRLSIPHPRMAQRRFVMEPLAEIAPRAVHPLLKTGMAALAAGITGQRADRERPHA